LKLIRSLALACALVPLLSGCASSPSSTFYVLTPIPEAAVRSGDIAGGGLSVGIGPVVFPEFLDRPQIVSRAGDNRLELDEFHRWGGTVQDEFLRVWGENLTHLLGTSRVLVLPSESRMPIDFRITGEVISFGGMPDDHAVLKVRWAVMDNYLEQTLAAREDVYRCPIGAGDTANAAAGAGAALGGREAHAALTAARSEATVAAMSRCLGEFSRDVAVVVGSLPKPLPPAATVSPL
jgi:uncharacterized lipoprotein YmbA